MASKNLHRRKTDTVFGLLARWWNFVDERRIDRHIVSLVILGGTVIITLWAMKFGWYSTRPGLEVAAIIAAVTAPYSALQAAAIAFYFRSKDGK